jgi:membrane protease YdiL (CAAX protease family)
MSATDARRPVPAPPGGLRSRVARHPLSAFLVLVAVVGWPLMSVPALTTHGVLPGGPLPQEPFALGTTLLVMLPAALWVTAVADGRPAVRALLRRAVRWRFGAGWWATVLLALPVLTLAVGVAAGQGLQTGDLLPALASGAFSVVTAVLLVHLWEETVWAGFFQGRLEQRHGFLPAAALTAVPFAAVHAPLSFTGDLAPGRLALSTGGLLVLGVLLRTLVGTTVRGRRRQPAGRRDRARDVQRRQQRGQPGRRPARRGLTLAVRGRRRGAVHRRRPARAAGPALSRAP